ncbi:MAG TPA: CPBP family intramembrane glutamic endopeptidase [Niastella sp.]
MKLDVITLSWICFFTGSLLVCFKFTLRTGWAVLLAAYALAFAGKQITIVGLAWLVLTAGALFAAIRLHGWKQVTMHGVFIVLSMLLFMHRLPGFNNLLVFDKVHFSPDAAPFTMYLNLDKPFIGFILFTCFGSIWYQNRPKTKMLLKAIGLPLLIIATICLGTALLLHFVSWDPRLPPKSWIWVLNNLLLVAVCEEAFFRGYLQGIIGKQVFKGKSPLIPLFITALLFGLAHTTGGPALMLLAFIAGSGYGWAYYKGGILAAILTHFFFNVLHFFLFTYPMHA